MVEITDLPMKFKGLPNYRPVDGSCNLCLKSSDLGAELFVLIEQFSVLLLGLS